MELQDVVATCSVGQVARRSIHLARELDVKCCACPRELPWQFSWLFRKKHTCGYSGPYIPCSRATERSCNNYDSGHPRAKITKMLRATHSNLHFIYSCVCLTSSLVSMAIFGSRHIHRAEPLKTCSRAHNVVQILHFFLPCHLGSRRIHRP